MELNNISQNFQFDNINKLIDIWGGLYYKQFSKGYIVSNQGPRQSMEDTWVISVNNSIIIYGIFDGHSGKYISSKLPKLFKTVLLNKINKIKNNKKQIIKTIHNFFLDIDKMFYNDWKINKFNQDGSTANIIICIDDDIYFINLGDSRSLFFNSEKIIFSTQDHKPNNLIEKNRIYKSGHFIEMKYNVYRIDGGLALSRAFGDFEYKITIKEDYDGENSAVCVVPDITVINVVKRDKPRYIIIASDGLWDVFTNKEVFEFINMSLKKGISTKQIMTDLLKMAYLKGSQDNISIILIFI